MKKLLLATLCGAMALALAVPAMADHTLGGYYRVQFMSVKTQVADEADVNNFVDQRLRAKWTNTLNDYVTVVWYGEVDTPWGEQSKGGIGGGGQFGADGVNIETKHVYASVKVPDTPFAFQAGIIGVADIFGSTYIDNDAASLSVTGKFGMADVNVFWTKFDEGDRTAEHDDKDLYAATVGLAPAEAVKVNLGVYYEKDNVDTGSNNETVLMTYGASAMFNAGPVAMDVGLALQDMDGGDVTADGSALMGYARAGMTFGKVKAFARLTYFSEDDSATDNDRWTNYSGFEFYKDGLMIFGTDVYYNNGPGGRHAYTDAAYAGYGLLGLTLGADMMFADAYNLHLGLFTGMTLDDVRDNGDDKVEGENLGVEVNAQLSRKVGEKATVLLRGAYAFLGDFYDNAGGEDPDDLYTVSLVLNIGY